MNEFLLHWLVATPGYAAPLLLACLGLIVNERAGVLNLGAEGMMACGALAAAAASLATGSPWPGLPAALLAGAALAAVFGLLSVYLRANQVIAGLIAVALGAGLTGVLGRDYVSQTLPGFGPLLFGQNALTWGALLLAVAVGYGLFHTTPGLRLRAVGEDPATADAAGIKVLLTRFIAVLIGGAFCGLAGAYLALASSQVWVEGMIAGRGWIAVGLVIFARWRPGLALAGALLFGAVEALIPRVQASGADVPIYLFMMLPYLTTLAVLVLVGIRGTRQTGEPAGLGVAYTRQDRH